MERTSVRELLKLLKQAKVSNEDMVELFVSMIQNQMMYGGTLQERIDYEVEIIKKKLLL